ncbi:hypothetical protein BC826DRAFT_233107 [Russula brevipes]|nr:hypothetical protein BC826DRAFT_233107 [Russula brevipes]
MEYTSTGSSKDNRVVRDGDLGSDSVEGRPHSSEHSLSTKKGCVFPHAQPVDAHNPAMATAERAMTRFLSRGPPSVPAAAVPVVPPLARPPRQTSQPTQPEGQTPQSPQRRTSQAVPGQAPSPAQPSAPQSPQRLWEQTTQTTPGQATQPMQEQKFQVTKEQTPQTAEGQAPQPAQQPAAANKQKKYRPPAVTASSSTTKG